MGKSRERNNGGNRGYLTPIFNKEVSKIVKEDDFIYVYKTGLTLQVKSDEFLEDYFHKHDSYAGKYTALWMAEYAVKEGLAIKKEVK